MSDDDTRIAFIARLLAVVGLSACQRPARSPMGGMMSSGGGQTSQSMNE